MLWSFATKNVGFVHRFFSYQQCLLQKIYLSNKARRTIRKTFTKEQNSDKRGGGGGAPWPPLNPALGPVSQKIKERGAIRHWIMHIFLVASLRRWNNNNMILILRRTRKKKIRVPDGIWTHGGSWVQIPSGTRIFFSESSSKLISSYLYSRPRDGNGCAARTKEPECLMPSKYRTKFNIITKEWYTNIPK